MNIAFCVNRLGLIGLGATVASLIRNCSGPESLSIYIFCAYVSDADKDIISRLFEIENFAGEYKLIDFDPMYQFGSLRPLHGDWTPYGILLLPDFIEDREVLYLDSDLIVELDVLQLFNFNFEDKALAAVPGGTVKTEYERDFYINKIGLSPDFASFNSGVVLFNLTEWRLNKLKDRCLEIAKRFPNDLLSADQTLLNAVFAGNFSKLPACYNCAWFAKDAEPELPGKAIIHFIGSPKPWDLFGFLIHKGFSTWKSYSNWLWEEKYIGASFLPNLKRTWNIRRSYVRVIKLRFSGN
ncbi:MAG: glycosyltransferase family 8 protein [Pyrinomonadaceae bacterium]|nr:glycosyltransferase family 8 protein [Sphingobacteriaceae bacterium]